MKKTLLIFFLLSAGHLFAATEQTDILKGPKVNVDPNDDAQKTEDFEEMAVKKPHVSRKANRRIQPNTGQCAPGQTSAGSSMGDAGVEDFHCTSPAPLGPDYDQSRKK